MVLYDACLDLGLCFLYIRLGITVIAFNNRLANPKSLKRFSVSGLHML